MSTNKSIVLSFDLDFTLIDNREGIVNSFNYALKKYNILALETALIEKMIGTPLEEMFAQVTDMDATPLCPAFREYYVSEGIFQVKVFPGVNDLLIELNKWFTLGVITSKKEEIAKKLLHHVTDVMCQSGVDTLYLEVRNSNYAARDLYEKHGFEAVGRRPGYYAADSEDAVLMRKFLKEG